MSPVRSLPSCWRNGCIHVHRTRLCCVEENCKITTHSVPITSLFEACPLHSFLVSPYILPPHTFFCPLIFFLPIFLCYNNCALLTLTPTPVLPPISGLPLHAVFPTTPGCVTPFLTYHTKLPHTAYSSVMVTETESLSKSVAVIASFHIPTYSPFIILNTLTISVGGTWWCSG
jgi:hypothetical protein